jgi:hypothetical protein
MPCTVSTYSVARQPDRDGELAGSVVIIPVSFGEKETWAVRMC